MQMRNSMVLSKYACTYQKKFAVTASKNVFKWKYFIADQICVNTLH